MWLHCCYAFAGQLALVATLGASFLFCQLVASGTYCFLSVLWAVVSAQSMHSHMPLCWCSMLMHLLQQPPFVLTAVHLPTAAPLSSASGRVTWRPKQMSTSLMLRQGMRSCSQECCTGQSLAPTTFATQLSAPSAASSNWVHLPLFGTTPPYAIGNAFLAQFTLRWAMELL